MFNFRLSNFAWPSFAQSRQLWGFLDSREKKVFLLLLLVCLASITFLAASFYQRSTQVMPASGGNFTEGLVGQPRFINPVLSPVSDVDRDLTQLVFAGLFQYSSTGQIRPDLARSYQISGDGKTWQVDLKSDLVFQDNTPLTTDDVIFTVKTIQNPDYKSPLRPAWLGVETEKISSTRLLFKLKNPYPAFLENLTLKILPRQAWRGLAPENFPLASFNLKPVRSGPYLVSKIITDNQGLGQIKSIKLAINPLYHGHAEGRGTKIREITFFFFDNWTDLSAAARNGLIQNYALADPAGRALGQRPTFSFELPRYFAVFFNPKNNSALADVLVRKALTLAVDKTAIVDQILKGQAQVVDSPLLPDLFGFKAPTQTTPFDPAQAGQLLDQAGFRINPQTQRREKPLSHQNAFRFQTRLAKGSQGTEVKELQKCLAKMDLLTSDDVTGVFGEKTRAALIRFQEKFRDDTLTPSGLTQGNGEAGEATRAKLNSVCLAPSPTALPLKFSLLTVDDPTLLAVAQLLKSQWAQIHVPVDIQNFEFNQLSSDYLRPRNYEALLFGEVLGNIPDPLPFWHSLGRKDPGLNLTSFGNKNADKLLAEARQTTDENLRQKDYAQFQDLLLKEYPAVFLYRPSFRYAADRQVKGILPGLISDPSQRFAGIVDWYIKTKRVWK